MLTSSRNSKSDRVEENLEMLDPSDTQKLAEHLNILDDNETSVDYEISGINVTSKSSEDSKPSKMESKGPNTPAEKIRQDSTIKKVQKNDPSNHPAYKGKHLTQSDVVKYIAHNVGNVFFAHCFLWNFQYF